MPRQVLLRLSLVLTSRTHVGWIVPSHLSPLSCILYYYTYVHVDIPISTFVGCFVKDILYIQCITCRSSPVLRHDLFSCFRVPIAVQTRDHESLFLEATRTYDCRISEQAHATRACCVTTPYPHSINHCINIDHGPDSHSFLMISLRPPLGVEIVNTYRPFKFKAGFRQTSALAGSE